MQRAFDGIYRAQMHSYARPGESRLRWTSLVLAGATIGSSNALED